jgi:oligopeptide/dipeptide ABC transporter ATP-binding protein
MTAEAALLSIADLHVEFRPDGPPIRALTGVDLEVHAGQAVGVVGETGSGKSVTALSVLGLTTGHVTGGVIHFDGRNLLELSERDKRALRGSEISMVFQEPMTSLDPSFTIGSQLVEVLRAHESMSIGDARRRAVAMLERVRMPHPERVMRQYPFELSGGMRQRAMIALALSCGPKLLIADEPTTALDVTVEAQILSLLSDIRAATGAALMLITHDLAIVAQTCDWVYVMYAGRVVESAPVERLFSAPRHPYTKGLMAAVPTGRQERLHSIQGEPPDPAARNVGCPFAPRCPFVMERCRTDDPRLIARVERHAVACHLEDHPG